MTKEYVEKRDEGYWVEGSRVSLDSIVYAFLDGQTAESTAQSFPTLSLEQVYGAIAFYLDHREEVDSYLAKTRADFEALRSKARDSDPAFYKKLADARRQIHVVPSMKVRYQADADLNLAIVLAVVRREPIIDFQTANAAGLAGMPDPKVLAVAAAEGRILVTHDHKTMPRHFANFLTDQTSSGLLVVPKHIPRSVVVEDLLLIWAASDASEWINRICYLPL